MNPRTPHREHFAAAFARSYANRQTLIAPRTVSAFRLFDGAGDGIAGVYVDRYGPIAILSVYEDSRWADDAVSDAARGILETLRATGLEAVYVKRFTKDRTRLGGRAPAESYSPTPRAGRPQPDTLIVEEYGTRFEVRPYDGFSTGLFVEHREHRRTLAERAFARALNLFAYTCAFSVPLAVSGAHVTNVDVSARYLEWGRRNHALNAVDTSRVRYARMDATAYLNYASRHAEERFDLIVIDPPTFGTGSSRRGIKSWKAVTDYPKLVVAAARVLAPNGLVFAATNTRELAADRVFRSMIETAIGRVQWKTLPPWPTDIRERGRLAAVLFRPR